MKSFSSSLDKWSKKHHPDWIDALRIVSALIIQAKTLLFISHTALTIKFLRTHNLGLGSAIITYGTGALILLGATMLFLGLQTRIVSLLLIPFVILSGLLSAALSTGFAATSDILLSVIILFILAFYFVEGSGKFSVDRIMKNNPNTLQPDKRA